MGVAAQNGTPRRTGEDAPSLGTRFLIYPQAPLVSGYDTPEPVWIQSPPDRVRAGPADDRIYVRDPLLDKQPYEFPHLPPFVGDAYPPAVAGPDGHFDHLDPKSREFLAAHAFASVRRVLDIWENYLGKPIVWYFAETYERLEIIPFIDWDNAQSGYGYIELGRERAPDGRSYPYALNFDVVAHEVGHAILFSLFGAPGSGIFHSDFAPFHEACADLISLLSFLHFDSGADRLLRHCRGNLLVLNELNRIAELTGDRQVRLASNARRLFEVSEEIHDRSRPFTGAVFDTMVDAYHTRLVNEDLADERLLEIDIRELDADSLHRISDFTSEAFLARPFLFKSALNAARDDVSTALALTWAELDANELTFESVALGAIEACERCAPALVAKAEENFRWRGIL